MSRKRREIETFDSFAKVTKVGGLRNILSPRNSVNPNQKTNERNLEQNKIYCTITCRTKCIYVHCNYRQVAKRRSPSCLLGLSIVFPQKVERKGTTTFERNSAIKTGEGGQYFRVRPRNSSVLEGGEVTIPCEVGNRVGIVQWVKDGFAYVIQPSGEIVGHPRLRLIGDQNAGIYNLKITDASLTDDGEYQCQVGPYMRIKSIRANAHLSVVCEYTTIVLFNFQRSSISPVTVLVWSLTSSTLLGILKIPLPRSDILENCIEKC
ncbi:Kin of IRRE-like protein 1 [Melipona quadrifasciata]|uniref:Kin of IRRE-like protein 1 n=1 Tax=Melipona quadrifasciata TaxID=166423 RepID=A0A0N0U3A6_9HYME|nr:Kin of IRRE-like protein 1 [Melipona quadrifasciata]